MTETVTHTIYSADFHDMSVLGPCGIGWTLCDTTWGPISFDNRYLVSASLPEAERMTIRAQRKRAAERVEIT